MPSVRAATRVMAVLSPPGSINASHCFSQQRFSLGLQSKRLTASSSGVRTGIAVIVYPFGRSLMLDAHVSCSPFQVDQMLRESALKR